MRLWLGKGLGTGAIVPPNRSPPPKSGSRPSPRSARSRADRHLAYIPGIPLQTPLHAASTPPGQSLFAAAHPRHRRVRCDPVAVSRSRFLGRHPRHSFCPTAPQTAAKNAQAAHACGLMHTRFVPCGGDLADDGHHGVAYSGSHRNLRTGALRPNQFWAVPAAGHCCTASLGCRPA